MQKIDLNKVYQRIRKSSDTLESIPEGADLSTSFDGKEKVSKATLKYLSLFQSKGKNFFISWNWAAAFFGLSWLLFRRAYLEVFLHLSTLFFLFFISSFVYKSLLTGSLLELQAALQSFAISGVGSVLFTLGVLSIDTSAIFVAAGLLKIGFSGEQIILFQLAFFALSFCLHGVLGNYLYVSSIARKISTNKLLRPNWLLGTCSVFLTVYGGKTLLNLTVLLFVFFGFLSSY